MSIGKQTDKKKSSSSSHFAAGLCSGLLSAILLQPADLLKTRIQQSPRNIPLPIPIASANAESLSIASQKLLSSTSTAKAVQSARTIRTCLAEILAQPEPIRELWRGTVASALRTGFGSALYFTTLNAMRRELARMSALSDGIADDRGSDPRRRENDRGSFNTANSTSNSALPRLSKMANLATGAAARAFAGFLLMPVTVLKVRMESNLHDHHGTVNPATEPPNRSLKTEMKSSASATKRTRMTMRAATRAIAQTDGLRGFFAGTGATAVRDAPYAGLYVLFYEWSKDVLGRAAATTAAAATAAAETPISNLSAPQASATSSAIPAVATVTATGISTGTATGTSTSKATVAAAAPSTMSINFFSATLAAGLATAATNPFDAIKTRLQLQPRRYGNMIRAARIMVMHEGGVRCLFDGLALRMGRKALSSAIAWTVYEEIIRRVEM